MASFIQSYVSGIVQNAATGAATYAITTGGRVVGDVVIGAGDLIEGSGRNVGNGIEGYIDRYGNWVRSYGNAAIAATAPSYGGYPVTQKALPANAGAKAKALPAPKKGAAGRPALKKSLSDTPTGASSGKKALPSSGVKKALPAPTTSSYQPPRPQQLSKGQLAKAKNMKSGAAKAATGPTTKPLALPAPTPASDAGTVAPSEKPSSARKARRLAEAKQKPSDAASVAGSAGPTSKTAGGKVKVAAESRPKPNVNVGGAEKSGAGAGGGKAAGGAKGGYDFFAPGKEDGKGKGGGGEKGGYDFLKATDAAKKKGPGSVAGSVAGSVRGGGKTSGGGGGGGGGAPEKSEKYDFF